MVISTRVEDWDESEPPIHIVFEDGQNVVATLTDVSSGVVVTRADLYLSSENKVYEKLDIPVIDNKMEFMFPIFIQRREMSLIIILRIRSCWGIIWTSCPWFHQSLGKFGEMG